MRPDTRLECHAPLLPTRRASSSAGFTLIELLAVMAVAVIMLTWAIPSYQQFTTRHQVTAEVMRLKNALALARNYAVTSRTTVSLCPVASVDAGSCDFSDWAQPLVIVEGYASQGELAGTRLLRVLEGGVGPLVTFNRELPVRHQPTGWTPGHNGTFDICGRHGHGARVIVSNMGRARVADNSQPDC